MAHAKTTIARPQRWDQPFDPGMSEADVQRVRALPPLNRIDPDAFPTTAPLDDILLNDAAVRRFNGGDIIMRLGDYGSSAFIVLAGQVRVVLNPPLPDALLGRRETHRKSWWGAFSQLWRSHKNAEVRDPAVYGRKAFGARGVAEHTRVFLPDPDAIASTHQTVAIGPGELFGEIAALSRSARTASVYADGEATVLEIRWQGLRDIRRYAADLRAHIETLYRERSLAIHLYENPLFQHLPEEVIDRIAEETLFEQYGEFDWYAKYRFASARSYSARLALEPVIASEGDYVDGLLMVRSGFARVSIRINNGHQTQACLGKGDLFGFEEIAHNYRSEDRIPLQRSLRAIGYVDILRTPTTVIEQYVLPSLSAHKFPPLLSTRRDFKRPAMHVHGGAGLDTATMEFLVENRFINGTAAMLIDLDRCVRCDDCVLACAAAHDNNPRFLRHGKRLDRLMIANACMHCVDPVCMIGCPTGAIHREASGEVVINDVTCIGCSTCANACPYDNIRMVEIREPGGELIQDQATNAPILKATKCDLCVDQPVSPACARNCPHDALVRMDMKNIPALSRWLNR